MEIQQCKVKSTFPALSQSHSGEWKRVQGLRKARFERETWTYFALLYLHNGRGSYLDFEPLGVLCLVTSARSKAPDGFDAVSVQNVGSTYIIVSWDLPTHSNGILINFSLYCNGALAGVLPLTVISYDTTGLLLFTLYMYMSSSHAHRHCTPVGTWCWASSVLQPACPGQSKVYTTIVLAKMNTIKASCELTFT
eukprot:Em0027g53a